MLASIISSTLLHNSWNSEKHNICLNVIIIKWIFFNEGGVGWANDYVIFGQEEEEGGWALITVDYGGGGGLKKAKRLIK